MDRSACSLPTTSADSGGGSGFLWLIPLLGLFAWQAWMTLTLFREPPPRASVAASDSSVFPQTESSPAPLRSSWQRLVSDEPLLSGQHPLHLYFGYLGARSLLERGTPCCYDPAFQAGYPKTPVFDSGSRPAELFLLAAGGRFRPIAYKLGLALCCLLVPLLLALSAWGLGLGRAGTCLTVALGLLVFWGAPGQGMLAEGDLDVLLAALCGLASICLLIRFDHQPSAFGWLAHFVTSCLGWYAHPLLLILLLPVALLYYLSVGPRHRLGWHLALLGSLGATLTVNSFWLIDWARSWWIRLPVQLGAEPLRHRTIQTVWDSPQWGEPADRALGVLLFLLGLAGVIVLNQSRRRASARLLGAGAGAFLALAIGGVMSPPLGRLGAGELLLPALWFSVPAAAFALVKLGEHLPHWCGGTGRAIVLGGALLALSGVLAWPFVHAWMPRCGAATPFEIGLGAERAQLIDMLRSHTSSDARILWEEPTSLKTASRWSVLLPLLTERSFVGGLDPTRSIEHAYATFADQQLAGRPLAEWSDVDLDDFCRRYNIGWIVCWSPASCERFRRWSGAAPLVSMHEQVPGEMFVVRGRSFVLKGQARWLGADRQRIALADVIPEDGEVVLSLHYQAGMQATPSRVRVEREPDPFDPIPFIRLKIPGPVARVTLTWDGR